MRELRQAVEIRVAGRTAYCRSRDSEGRHGHAIRDDQDDAASLTRENGWGKGEDKYQERTEGGTSSRR
jgi:hypothetical protein